MSVTIYTDGACSGNPGPGGWACILTSGQVEKVLTGYEPTTTNNRMELQAAISGLEALKYPCVVTVLTDSEYVRKGITEWVIVWKLNGWRNSQRKPVENRDLWERLIVAASTHSVTWERVAGHSGDRNNERCDQLAVRASKGILA